jgi:hypothetical protein
MTLYLGNIIEQFTRYHIDEVIVKSTHENPDRTEALPNNLKLYIKSFVNPDSKKTLLLMGTYFINRKEILGFAFWVPQIFLAGNVTLIDVLKLFANQFGLRIKIGSAEGQFITWAEKLFTDKFDSANAGSHVTKLAPEGVPCQLFFSTSESTFGKLNKVHFHYAFSLNTGKYQFWVDSAPLVTMSVKSGAANFVKNKLLDFVQPHGHTKIEIQNQITRKRANPHLSDTYETIEVPAVYERQFQYILNQINNLEIDEKIVHKISFMNPRCLFCNAEETTKEHIFPKWLRPYLNETVFSGSTLLSNTGNEPLEKMISSATTDGKKESSHGYTAKLVCAKCNNTWMSQLEANIKSILLKHDKLVSSLHSNISKSDATTLAQWLVVKSLLLSNKHLSNIHSIKKNVFEGLSNGQISKGFLVEATTADNPKLDFMLGRGLMHENSLKLNKLELERAKELAENFFTCAIQLNHLLFRVTYLEPEIPLVMETVLKKTLKLFPFAYEISHKEINDECEIWQSASNDNLELPLFTSAWILRER